MYWSLGQKIYSASIIRQNIGWILFVFLLLVNLIWLLQIEFIGFGVLNSLNYFDFKDGETKHKRNKQNQRRAKIKTHYLLTFLGEKREQYSKNKTQYMKIESSEWKRATYTIIPGVKSHHNWFSYRSMKGTYIGTHSAIWFANHWLYFF